MKNVQKKVPSILLMIVLVGFPQISESIFTPALPEISRVMQVSPQITQLTMSTYFGAFAFGVLFWGWLSDKIGRRPSMLWGIGIYLIGNLGLLMAPQFPELLMARMVQAFGASVGSVVTQTIMREAFSGITGAKVFAKIGAAMALAPALGPLIGGLVQTYFGYRSVFSVLVVMAISAGLYAFAALPETRVQKTPGKVAVRALMKRLLSDRKVWAYGILISGVNGILFSYYAEAPFVFMSHFKLTAIQYGLLGLVLAAASILGAVTTNYGLAHFDAVRVARSGLWLALFSGVGLVFASSNDQLILIIITIFGTFWGLNTTLPIALNLALVGYETVIGTASGLFSFAYYWLISLLTYGISRLHTGSILVLPIYMVSLMIIMLIAYYGGVRQNKA